MPTRMNFRERCTKRQEFAAEQAASREKRGDTGQLARLEANGHGHCREAEKLRQGLNKIEAITEEPASADESAT